MRSDESLPADQFRASQDWEFDTIEQKVRPEIDRRYSEGFTNSEAGRRWHSFSGRERNRLFLNHNGSSFTDESSLSGADTISDSRSFAVWDFDKDGRLDIALANANEPFLNFYHNQLRNKNQFVAIRLIGGNQRPESNKEWSNRDGVGAKLHLEVSGSKIVREFNRGEGFAAQNSSTMIVGIGDTKQVDKLTILWPSGKESTGVSIPAGSLATVVERNREILIEPYEPIAIPDEQPVVSRLVISQLDQSKARFRLITTMATWCDACRRHVPQTQRLRQAFSSEQLGIFGVPGDSLESESELESYVDKQKPGYLLTKLNANDLVRIRRVFKRDSRIPQNGIPASILLDSKDRVLGVFPGVPTVSEVGQLLE